MNMELLVQLSVGIIPSIITGICSYRIAVKKCKNEIEKLNQNNKNEIEKLMTQHEIDIENLKEKSKIEAEAKQHEHDLKIKEMEVQNEQEILKKEKDFESQIKYTAMGNFFQEYLNSDELKKQMNNLVTKEINKYSKRSE